MGFDEHAEMRTLAARAVAVMVFIVVMGLLADALFPGGVALPKLSEH